MRTVIIANGNPPDAGDIRRWLRPGDPLICADGGARAALALGLTPHTVIGDFDSLSEDDLQQLARRGAALHRYPTRKDETDLELALTYAMDSITGAEPAEIVILGALGGRLDQTVANVMLLAMPRLAGARVLIAAGNEQTFLITPDQPADLRGSPGDIVSLIPFGGDAHGVRTEGLEYPLRDEPLIFGPARGVSNVMLGQRAGVTIREGRLLCVHATAP
ncbi:MAG: thiamine diphosphokinase [Candidatus Roseilinea sp.]|uniref:thiamine diphosphokinase n=1 Tax=Candidatus Roseilinea sp. TaxID=2838777 RepID=UPI00404B70C5